jgi:5'-nucleotidase
MAGPDVIQGPAAVLFLWPAATDKLSAVRILLSNDDGILAPGLAALHAAVRDLGDTTVVAPSSPQSAAGHSITLKDPLVVHRIQVSNGPEPFWVNSVDGRPADCVRLAVRKLLAEWPDVVLSGINAGANVGINVFYSGTVAAAAEAAMLGIPSIAFSAGYDRKPDEIDYARAGRLCRWVLDRLLEIGLRERDLINVNLPSLGPGRPVGVRVVPQSTAELDDFYHSAIDGQGRELYHLSDSYSFAPVQEDTDVVRLGEGYITITPLHVDMTDRRRMEALAGDGWGELPG